MGAVEVADSEQQEGEVEPEEEREEGDGRTEGEEQEDGGEDEPALDWSSDQYRSLGRRLPLHVETYEEEEAKGVVKGRRSAFGFDGRGDLESTGGQDDGEGKPESTVGRERRGTEGVADGHFPVG